MPPAPVTFEAPTTDHDLEPLRHAINRELPRWRISRAAVARSAGVTTDSIDRFAANLPRTVAPEPQPAWIRAVRIAVRAAVADRAKAYLAAWDPDYGAWHAARAAEKAKALADMEAALAAAGHQ